MIMAAAPTPLPAEESEQEVEILNHHSTLSFAAVGERPSMNPLLIVMFAGLAVFPFLVGFLPAPVAQHLDILFH
jgi:hypothetical protein